MTADEEIVWTTKDNKSIKLKDMHTQHLKNAARMLRRNVRQARSSYYATGAMLQGDMAIDDWEVNGDQLFEYVDDREELASAMERVVLRRINKGSSEQ